MVAYKKDSLKSLTSTFIDNIIETGCITNKKAKIIGKKVKFRCFSYLGIVSFIEAVWLRIPSFAVTVMV
jgi:hypothetical protein